MWTRHAHGTLARAGADPSAHAGSGLGLFDGEWPPPGAVEVGVDGVYERLADAGFDYGPAFQGLRRMWRKGEDLLAEVALPEGADAGVAGFDVHPAVFDAMFHGVIDGLEAPRLPFAWSGVECFAGGAPSLRVSVSPAGDGGVSLLAVDELGAPVLSVERLTTREVSPEQLARARAATGRTCDSLFGVDWVEVGSDSAEDLPGVERLAPGEGLASLLEAVAGERAVPGIVWADLGDDLAAAAGEGLPGTARGVLRDALKLLQEWLAEESFADSRLVFVTQAAVAVAEEGVPGLAAAGVWGLVRSALCEHPGRFGLVDVDGGAVSWGALGEALGAGEAQLAVRDGVVLAPRLVRASPAPARGGAAGDGGVFGVLRDGREAGTVLVTGGTGGLGALLARHLVAECGVEHLVLVSRGGLGAQGAVELVEELEESGASVRIEACDVCDRAQLQALIASIDAEHPLCGVVHAASAGETGLLGVVESLDGEGVERAVAAKLDGAWHLHELTEHLELGAFVLFSSMAGVFGGPGQGSYAAGNTFLDALAAHRRERGLAGVSLAWGLWGGVGLGRGLGERDLRRMAGTAAFGVVSGEEGLELLSPALSTGRALVIPVPLQEGVLRAEAGAGELPGLLRGLARRRPRARKGPGPLAARLAEVGEGERERVVLRLVREHVARVLGHASEGAVNLNAAFRDLGFDSLAAIELRNRLGAATGLRLAATIVFDHPTTRELARHLLREVVETGLSPSQARGARVAGALDEPIAIVGMGCRYPGGVRSPEDLWELVARGRRRDRRVPRRPRLGRWGARTTPTPTIPGTSYTRHGGFLYDAGEFDPAFFGISPREALAMDPQQRLLLRGRLGGARTRRHRSPLARGHPHRRLRRRHVPRLRLRPSGSDAQGVEGHLAHRQRRQHRLRPGRLHLRPRGPGRHRRHRLLLLAGRAAPGLPGAARRRVRPWRWPAASPCMATPGLFVEFSRQRGLAPDGRCKSFAARRRRHRLGRGRRRARSLERLSDAQRNGHPVLAVMRGSAVNQDGASNGLTAPNGPAQQRVIRQALADAGLSPAEVDAVEAHGTGTTLGDPIEAQALLATYGQRPRRPASRCGSARSSRTSATPRPPPASPA